MPDKPDNFVQLEAQEPDKPKKELHPGKMRAYIRHLSVAAIRAEELASKKQDIKQRLDRIKSVSLNKRSTKTMIEHEIGSFEDAVQEIIKDEEKILEEQRRETKQITELKAMVENLSKKLIGIGREYAGELEEKDGKIMELREALASAHIKISESGEERQKKIENIEQRLKEKHGKPKKDKPKTKAEHVNEIEGHLNTLEAKHKELKKKGKHKKKDLDRVKKLIDTHKGKLKTIKAKKK
ncbi:hypothetical protein ACFL3V_05445 [Nanoarchaeota archaeon]